MNQTPGIANRSSAGTQPVSGSGTIRRKLLGGLLLIALIPLVVLGVVTYFQAEQAILTKSGEQLEAVRGHHAKLLRQQFQTWEKELATFVESELAVKALTELRVGFLDITKEIPPTPATLDTRRDELLGYYSDLLGEAGKEFDSPAWIDSLGNSAVLLQSQFLANNPNPLGQKHKLDRGPEVTAYNDRHAIHHPQLRTWLDHLEIRDLILVDAESGDVVYSFLKQPNFAVNLKGEAATKTGLGRAFARAAANESGVLSFEDFERDVLSRNESAGFLSAPVFDSGMKIGVVIWQLPIEAIACLFQDRTGLGTSGESLIVGPDHLLRDGTATKIENPAALAALAGGKTTLPTRNNKEVAVLTAAEAVTVFKGLTPESATTWAVLSEMSLAEVKQPLWNMARMLLGIGAIAALLVALAALALSRRMTRQTDAISGMLSQIGIGNFAARAEVVSNDELGHVATSLNAMCDNTLSLIQTKDERDQIQHAVQKLKEEVAIIASGDLSREAEVTDDVTGGIAESINLMIFQLRTLIGNMHETVTQVTSSADEIRKTAEYMSLGADQQAMQIVGTSSSINEMAQSIQQVSEHTEQSSIVANKARENAVHGTESVRNTMRGMDRIRDQVQDNAKRIKRLGETSQEVGEIVQLIGDIADRTSILALNASIQAAMAGEAGKGFGVVAEEVERLAERANHATKQIDSLIKAMQSETSEAIMAMEICTQEVVEGSKIASEAGMALDEIDEVSHDLAELLQSITTATRQQARGAESVSKAMSSISTVTQQTTSSTKRAAESVGNLAALAEALRDSVAAFKLPRMLPRPVNVFDSPEPHQMNPIGSLILKALK